MHDSKDRSALHPLRAGSDFCSVGPWGNLANRKGPFDPFALCADRDCGRWSLMRLPRRQIKTSPSGFGARFMPVLAPKKFKLGHYRLSSHPSARLQPEFSEGNQDELDDPDES